MIGKGMQEAQHAHDGCLCCITEQQAQSAVAQASVTWDLPSNAQNPCWRVRIVLHRLAF
jgi:hypothetical protein